MNKESLQILLIGGGGREHALAWKMVKSPLCGQLLVAPGNAGTDQIAKNVDLNITDFSAVKTFLLDQQIDLIVVGPEAPLVEGLFDQCKEDEATRHIHFVGPSKEGAQLEGSKAYAKEFMAENKIPTAAYKEINKNQIQDGYAFLESMSAPYVLKADGLAAGKGVLIIEGLEEAKAALKTMLDGQFGDASSKVVIEAFLKGVEFSVFVLSDGDNYKILPVAKDYKRIGEGDTGLNTGGMGAVSPVPFVDATMMAKVEERIIKPTIAGLKNRNITYRGFIFIGLIEVDNEPFVIEYNCRMGDPETEVVIPRIESDIVPLFLSLENEGLAKHDLIISPKTAATIMLVSGGYPEAYEKGKAITGLDTDTQSLIFHAGTKKVDDKICTNGGRVLAITSMGDTIEATVTQSRNMAEKIHFDKKYYRKDIGNDLV